MEKGQPFDNLLDPTKCIYRSDEHLPAGQACGRRFELIDPIAFPKLDPYGIEEDRAALCGVLYRTRVFKPSALWYYAYALIDSGHSAELTSDARQNAPQNF